MNQRETEHLITPEIEPFWSYVNKIWEYKSLITSFAYRDIKIRYSQTFFGLLWVLFQPLPSVVIFTFFFAKVIHVNSGGLPYPVFALIGLGGWNYFTNLTNSTAGSLIEAQHVIKKIYFPKIVLPLSKILVAGFDFLITFFVIIIVMLFYRLIPGFTLIYLPLFLAINILTGFSAGIWISALTFRYRDFQNIIPHVIMFSIWLTPVFYPTTILPPSAENLMFFNPMAFVIEGYRFCLSGGIPPSPRFIFSVIPVVILLLTGLWYFRKVEDNIADFI